MLIVVVAIPVSPGPRGAARDPTGRLPTGGCAACACTHTFRTVRGGWLRLEFACYCTSASLYRLCSKPSSRVPQGRAHQPHRAPSAALSFTHPISTSSQASRGKERPQRLRKHVRIRGHQVGRTQVMGRTQVGQEDSPGRQVGCVQVQHNPAVGHAAAVACGHNPADIPVGTFLPDCSLAAAVASSFSAASAASPQHSWREDAPS